MPPSDDLTAIAEGEFDDPNPNGTFDDGVLEGGFDETAVFVGAAMVGPVAVGEGTDAAGEDDEAVGG